MNRRHFLQVSALTTGFVAPLRFGSLAVAAHSPGAFRPLETENDNILIIIQLFGGNDGLNTVIPADDGRYYSRYRRKLAIPKEKALRLNNGAAYLHPALGTGPNEGLLGLFKSGKLAVVQGVGYENPDLSHFRSTDIWLSGQLPANATQRLDSGWLGRYFGPTLSAATPPEPLCVRIGGSTSLLFQSRAGDVALALENPADFYQQGKDVLSSDVGPTDGSAFAAEFGFVGDLAVQSFVYSSVVKRAFDAGKNSVEYEKNALSDQARLTARLISGGLKSKVYLLSIDGFDTHANQGGEGGTHAALLTQVSTAVSALMADLEKQGQADRVVGLTVSEFGRRPEENASNGTDHGAAGVMFVFGNAVKGRVVGQNLSFDRLDANLDFRHQFDYRRVYDEVLRYWFGTAPATVADVLNGRFELIENGLLRHPGEVTATAEPAVPVGVSPNPTPDGAVTVRLSLELPAQVSIRQVNALGRDAELFRETPLPAGNHQLPVRLLGGAGVSTLLVQTGQERVALKVVRL